MVLIAPRAVTILEILATGKASCSFFDLIMAPVVASITIYAFGSILESVTGPIWFLLVANEAVKEQYK